MYANKWIRLQAFRRDYLDFGLYVRLVACCATNSEFDWLVWYEFSDHQQSPQPLSVLVSVRTQFQGDRHCGGLTRVDGCKCSAFSLKVCQKSSKWTRRDGAHLCISTTRIGGGSQNRTESRSSSSCSRWPPVRGIKYSRKLAVLHVNVKLFHDTMSYNWTELLDGWARSAVGRIVAFWQPRRLTAEVAL